MKTLAKPIAIFLILALTVFSVEAQKEHVEPKNYKFCSAGYWLGEDFIEITESKDVVLKGLDNESISANSLHVDLFVFDSNDDMMHSDYVYLGFMYIKMKIKPNLNEVNTYELYSEIIEIYHIDTYTDSDFGENTYRFYGFRENGEDFVYVFKVGSKQQKIHIANEKKQTEYVIYYAEME